MESNTSVTSKGQVTIPVAIRRALGLKARDRVSFSLSNGVATMRKAESVVESLAGSVRWPDGEAIDFASLRRQFEDEIARGASSDSVFEPSR